MSGTTFLWPPFVFQEMLVDGLTEPMTATSCTPKMKIAMFMMGPGRRDQYSRGQ